MSQASRRHALAPNRERLSVIKFIARADPDCGEGIIAHPPARSEALHGLLGYDVPFNVAKVRAEANLVRLYGKHAHRVKRRHDVDSGGRHRWASPVGDWADEAPGVPWPYMDGDDMALIRVAEAVLRAIDGQPDECMSCVAESDTLTDVLETIARLRHDRSRCTLYIPAKPWIRLRSTAVDETQTRTEADVLMTAASSEINILIASPCPICNGSRENTRGSLPKTDVSPLARRKVCDGSAMRSAHDVPREILTSTWTRELSRAWERWRSGLPGYGTFQTVRGGTTKTRVVDRGEHRHDGAWPPARHAWQNAEPGTPEREGALDLLISERRWDVWGDDDRPYPSAPRWVWGEWATFARQRSAPTRRFMANVGREIRPAFQTLMREINDIMEDAR